MATEQDGTSFGPVDESGVDFGRSAMSAEQESGYSPGGFAEKMAAEDDRVTPGNLFASPVNQPLPPRSIPPMPGAVAPPPPPLNPVFTPVPGAPVQPFQPVAPPHAPAPVAPATSSAPSAQAGADPFAGAVPPPAPAAAPAPVAPVAAPAPSQTPVPVAPVPVPPVPAPSPMAPVPVAATGAPIADTGFATTVSNPILPPIPPARTKSRLRRFAPLVATPVVLALAGGSFAAYQFGVFGAPGTQPAAVVPATVFAYAAIDLNPSADAKLGVYEFSRNFESAKGVTKDSFKDEMLAEMAAEVPELDYAKDLAPWVGDRAAVAAVPDSTAPEGVAPLVVVQTTDEEKTDAFLTKADERVDDDSPLYWGFRDGYALIAPNASVLKAATQAETTLEDNTVYAADRARLGEDVLAHAWVDTAALIKALPEEARAEIPEATIKKVSGSAVVGATVTGDYFQLAGHATGFDVPAGEPTKNLDAMPAGATAAFAVTGLGPALTDLYSEAEDAGLTDAVPLSGETGLNLPEDLNHIFGTDFAVAVEANQPAVLAKVSTDDPDTSTAVVNQLLNSDGSLGVNVQTTEDGYTASLNDWTNDKTLTSDPKFSEAVPHAAGARLVAYVDIAPLVAQYQSYLGAGAEGVDAAEEAAEDAVEVATGDATAVNAAHTNDANGDTDEGLDSDSLDDLDDLDDLKGLKASGLSINPTTDGMAFTYRLTVGD